MVLTVLIVLTADLPWLEALGAGLWRVVTVSARLRPLVDGAVSDSADFVSCVTVVLRVFTDVLVASTDADATTPAEGRVALGAVLISVCAWANAASMALARSWACGSACLSATMPKSTLPA